MSHGCWLIGWGKQGGNALAGSTNRRSHGWHIANRLAYRLACCNPNLGQPGAPPDESRKTRDRGRYPDPAGVAGRQDSASRVVSRASTAGGTRLLTSPPYLAKSLTRLDERNAYSGLVVMNSVSTPAWL